MAGTDASIDVQGPPGHAFGVWAAFAEHARFLHDVERVVRRGDELEITGRVGLRGRPRTWTAHVVAEELDRRLAWRAPDGPVDVEVLVEPIEDGTSTRVRVRRRFHGLGRVDALLAASGLLAIRARGDLKRYKAVVEGGTAVGMSW